MPISASAGWRTTAWGMTPHEVKNALDQPTYPPQGPAVGTLPRVQFQMPYQAGSLTFVALFQFTQATDGQLEKVALVLQNAGQRERLLTALKIKYGESLPVANTDRSDLDLTWIEGDTRIEYRDDEHGGGRVEVIYGPARPPEVSGL